MGDRPHLPSHAIPPPPPVLCGVSVHMVALRLCRGGGECLYTGHRMYSTPPPVLRNDVNCLRVLAGLWGMDIGLPTPRTPPCPCPRQYSPANAVSLDDPPFSPSPRLKTWALDVEPMQTLPNPPSAPHSPSPMCPHLPLSR